MSEERSSRAKLIQPALLILVDLAMLELVPIGLQLFARTSGVTGGADLATRSWTYGLGAYYMTRISIIYANCIVVGLNSLLVFSQILMVISSFEPQRNL